MNLYQQFRPGRILAPAVLLPADDGCENKATSTMKERTTHHPTINGKPVMTFRKGLLLLLIFFVSCNSLGSSDDEYLFQVYGRVTINGQPAEGILVRVENSQSLGEDETNMNGLYIVDWVRNASKIPSIQVGLIDYPEDVVFDGAPGGTGSVKSVFSILGETGRITGKYAVEVNFTGIGPAAGICGDFSLRLDYNPIEVVGGTTDYVAVFVDRAAGFTGQVELYLFSVDGGSFWSDVMDTWSFSPNPVEEEAMSSTFSFTMREDISMGESYDFEIAGASPGLEQVPAEQWCRIPLTFEVVQ